MLRRLWSWIKYFTQNDPPESEQEEIILLAPYYRDDDNNIITFWIEENRLTYTDEN